ncbi:MAG: fibro-slime domain-containing protein, partial [Planctomycetota bacterium]
DRKPVFTGNGFKVRHPWRDSVNRPICHLLYDPSRGDIEGLTGVSDQGAIESAESFATWFNDVPGVNLSIPLSIKMIRQDDGTYVFDDKDDPTYVDLGGFFPLEDQLFGNSGGSPDRNFHFTFELHCEFEYDAAAGQVFEFVGDDDVWVFINDKLVIDLGGVHSAENQFVDLARLPGLEDGETYRLDFFFAERHRTQSNFRIQTNIAIRSLDTPMLTAIFD